MSSKKHESMIGRTYLFRGEQHTVERIEPYEDDRLDVYTDKRRIRIVQTELKEFLPVHVPTVQKKDTEFLAAYKENAKPMGDLVARLDKLIDKIDADPKYIPQAEAINETARSIVHTWKTQIELLKVMKS